MAKPKKESKGNSKPKQTAKSVQNPIRVRSTHEQSDSIRQKALRAGAASVATMAVGPNYVETIVVFAKKSAANEFSKGIQSSRNIEIV